MTDFQIVKDFEPSDKEPSDKNVLTPRVQAVLDGELIFVPGMKSSSVSGGFGSVKARGYKVRTHRAERNGVAGVYIWAEKP